METSQIKRFAAEARKILIEGVIHRFSEIGFNSDGKPIEEPKKIFGGAIFMGRTVNTDFLVKWESLELEILKRGIKSVTEEVAYTWFNRMVAIRILARNGIISPVLEYDTAQHIPLIVSDARKGRCPKMDDDSRSKLNELLDDDSKTFEQFTILITAFCHSNPIINSCFGHISDYTELLLPRNILADSGFVAMLNNTPFITDDDYRSPELIGWLYQFYISEKKDDVFSAFKSGKKAETTDDIAAATQIFTPNWIVKYMVQNTLGRIYLDNNEYSSLKDSMLYLVDGGQNCNTGDNVFRYSDIHELTCADLACGSGHILNECFDLLLKMYIEEGYSRRNAIEDIFRYNITGIDLDTRAKQLAQFALLLKACQNDDSFSDAHCMPRIYDMPQTMPRTDQYLWEDVKPVMLAKLGLKIDGAVALQIHDAFALLAHADTLGSLMKFNLDDIALDFIRNCIERYETVRPVDGPIATVIYAFRIILALTQKYAAIVMNPPYMGSGNMNAVLGDYVKKNYAEGKADLFSSFMIVAIDNLADNGKYGMINMHSWMFLSSFESLRHTLLENYHIDNMLHLGPRTFDELSGEVVQNASYIVSKYKGENSCGTYFRLVDGKNCGDKEQMFLDAQSAHTSKVYYPNVFQKNFEKIPGWPLVYWLSDIMLSHFDKDRPLSKIADLRSGISTGDNNRFYRLWFECDNRKISPNEDSTPFNSKYKWFKIIRGGSYRRWYGCCDNVINLYDSCHDIKNSGLNHRLRTPSYYIKKGITWNRIASGKLGFRIKPNDYNFGENSPCMFLFDENDNLFSLLAILNSNCIGSILFSLVPTLSNQVADLTKIPIPDFSEETIEVTVKDSISISRQDWDSHETSWDFACNPLLATVNYKTYMDNLQRSETVVSDDNPHIGSLKWCYEQYRDKWENLFLQLHANEEELNRQFIDIYGLQDELTPDVPLDEVTILQQGEISIENNQIVWHPDVVIKQFISYAIGCLMGRYSIDREGLILANHGDGVEQYRELVPKSRFDIDDDGIIPLMPDGCDFNDNAILRIRRWLAVAMEDFFLVENLNFIDSCLGKTLEQYLIKDFWKDHKKMYQNKPIYWLFSSKKGTFQCLVYMHRMNPYTVERIRTRYLLVHIDWLVRKQTELKGREAELSTAERKRLDNIGKQIAECREYEERLHLVADKHIDFDLDDGVAVNIAKFGDVVKS